MAKLILSSISNNEYLIKGDYKSLLKNSMARLAIKKLNYKDEDDGLHIDSPGGIDYVVKILRLAAKYIKADVDFDEGANDEIKEFQVREHNFKTFSEQAKLIKSDNFESEQFSSFTQTLVTKMTNRTLYKLQLLAAYHIAFSQNGCNFSVPGAGKTSIVYGAYAYLKSLPTESPKYINKLLIIGPLSSFGPWEREYKECFGIKPSSKRINGSLPLEEKKQYFYSGEEEITLISYASVISVKEELKYFLNQNKVMVVLDEAHKIKNTSGGITAASIMELAELSNSRVILTGTPAPNGYEDLYNLFRFIWPRNNVIRYSVAQLREMSRNDDDSRIGSLLDNIDPYFIRIKKSDLGIPDPIEHDPITVPMKPAQQNIYDFIEQQFINSAEDADMESEFHSSLVRAKLIRLQQVATNPALLKKPLTDFVDDFGDSFNEIAEDDNNVVKDIIRFYNDKEVPAKFEVCLNLIKSIIENGSKVIVWAIFIDNIKYLHNFLLSQGIESRCLYGATPVATEDMDDEELSETREGIVEEFHNPDSSFKVIIANPFAVAESISLHKACHHAIYLERSFNCAHFVQSKDRIHRYGLKPGTETHYYYILSENTVDQTVDRRLRMKEERMNRIIESMPIPLFDNIGTEGRDDIKAIIEDYVNRGAK